MRVSFLNPGGSSDAFYDTMVLFMRLAAAELEIELEVLDSNRDMAVLKQRADELLARSSLPEYLLLVNEQGMAPELMARASSRGIKVLLINQGLLAPDRQTHGEPRQVHENWLGELVPDDTQAGYLLAKALIEEARRLPGRDRGAGIRICGVGGAFTGASLLRISGLRKALGEAADVALGAVMPAHWDRDQARTATEGLLRRFRRVDALWAASDLMALGAAEAIAEAGLKPGADVALGGIDWAPFAFEKLREGMFTASVGGHFLEGAWALILLYDYHHGHDFGADRMRSGFTVATRADAGRYERLFDGGGGAPVRFSPFSKARNPDLGEYRFTIDAMLG